MCYHINMEIGVELKKTLVFTDDFNGTTVDANHWYIYDGWQATTGEVWFKDCLVVKDGLLKASSFTSGKIPGMAHKLNQKYGVWEVRAKFSAPADPYLNPVFLLWPQNDNSWPAAGEIDFTENYDPDRQYTEGFLHFSRNNLQSYGVKTLDMRVWHNYAVVWTAEEVSYYIDGQRWFIDTNIAHIPTGPMHLCLQMNNNATIKSGRIPSSFTVDWVKIYK